MSQIVADRFLSHCEEDPLTGCWIWKLALTKKGYGKFKYNYETWKANRFSYYIFVGELGNLHALHKCNNTSCVKPSHLYAGTNDDNVKDSYADGRYKLTIPQVQDIKRRLKQGETQIALSREFNVSSANINRIAQGQQGNNI